MILIVILFVLIIALLVTNIVVVPQANAYVIEWLGSYKTTWGNGLHIKIPFLERVARKVSLKEQVADFPPQPVITKDNVTMQIDTVVYLKISDPKLYTYGVERPIQALENLTATTLRNIIGDLELDETLTSRDVVNARMKTIIDEATDPWGIKVTRVELKNIIPPREIQEAMEKQMKAEREKRQTLLEADAHKQAVVARAEGDKQAMILEAEANRDAQIARAKGEAESIRMVYEAEAAGLNMLKEAFSQAGVLELKKLDALKALGDGNATKLVVPTELASVASSLTLASELFHGEEPAKKVVADVNTNDDECCDDEERSTETKYMAGL